MAKQLPDELYIEIFKLTGENPMLFRVCKYFNRIIFDQFPFSEWLTKKLCRMIIWFNRIDLLKTKIVRDYPSFKFYPVVYASYFNNTSALKILLTNPKVDPSAWDNEAIVHASEWGHIEIVRLLLSDPRVDPSAQDNYAIRWASENGHVEVVKLLLSDPRVDPSANGNTAIKFAFITERHEIVKLLLEDPRVYSTIDGNQFLKK